MDWNIYWTIIGQVLLALLILTLPLATAVVLLVSAVELGSRRPKQDGRKIL